MKMLYMKYYIFHYPSGENRQKKPPEGVRFFLLIQYSKYSPILPKVRILITIASAKSPRHRKYDC